MKSLYLFALIAAASIQVAKADETVGNGCFYGYGGGSPISLYDCAYSQGSKTKIECTMGGEGTCKVSPAPQAGNGCAYMESGVYKSLISCGPAQPPFDVDTVCSTLNDEKNHCKF